MESIGCTRWVIAVAFAIHKEGTIPQLPGLDYDYFAEFDYGCEHLSKKNKKLQISAVNLQAALDSVLQAKETEA